MRGKVKGLWRGKVATNKPELFGGRSREDGEGPDDGRTTGPKGDRRLECRCPNRTDGGSARTLCPGLLNGDAMSLNGILEKKHFHFLVYFNFGI